MQIVKLILSFLRNLYGKLFHSSLTIDEVGSYNDSMIISLVNKSTKLVNSQIANFAYPLTYQLRYHVAPAWGKVPAAVVFYADETQVPSSAHVIYFFDNADQANALEYHTETPTGFIYGKVFVDPVLSNGGSVSVGANSVLAVTSHEVIEMFIDPNCNLWADIDGNKGVAFEACDPVENDAYYVPLSRGSSARAYVSNFVFPEWFDAFAPAGSRCDHMSTTGGPFQMSPNGYMVVEDEGGTKEIFGDKFPEWKKAGKASVQSRTYRRVTHAEANSS